VDLSFLILNMNIKFNLTIGALFLLAGALLGSESIIHYVQSLSAHPAPTSPQQIAIPQNSHDQKTEPTHISIDRIGLSVDIEPGYYDATQGVWTVSDTKAQFATTTSQPNKTAGNTFIYGHNRAGIFGNLHKSKVGDEAIVTTTHGVFTYKLVSYRDVSPNDTSLFTYTGKPILTLQTCSGSWDQYRRLFVFNLEKVS
jgi:LPXTG-site transpeptidase (sortase) family protein